MKNIPIIAIFITLISVINCTKKKENSTIDIITKAVDYNKFLQIKQNKDSLFTLKEIEFWQKKFNAAPNQYTFLSPIALNYSKLFEITGNIDFLIKSETLLVQSNEAYKYSSVETVRALALNYYTQHRFKEALILANKALAIGEEKLETQKLVFDIQLELGNYKEAEKALLQLNNKEFDYYIRISKWSTLKGNLEKAISFMEKAAKVAEFNDVKENRILAYCNLVNLKLQAGNVQEAYTYCLKILELNPNNINALKSIAFIAFSNDKNTEEAKRIIAIIQKKYNAPDLFLLKSEIATYEKNSKAKEENIVSYFVLLQNKNYGAMYNYQSSLMYANDKNTASIGLIIAKLETRERPNPLSYDLLAWCYYNLGDAKKALEIEQKYVVGKSFQSLVKYHLATIYKANNLLDKVKPIKEELLNNYIELGPNIARKINKL